ncbi:MAG: efflux RND transporter periplasmic adaptor subunit [Nitrospinae bacterium]|nr:efflux RND transporter periplasmic adaptor subunit [Nitrospinota bacterium]
METSGGDRNSGAQRRLGALIRLAAVFSVAGLAYTGWWFWYGQFSEQTDNAYAAGDLVFIEPQTSGVIVAIHADNTDMVEQGQPLVSLGKTDAAIWLESAKARLADATRQAIRLREQAAQAAATVALKQIELAQAREDLARREALRAEQAVAEEEYARIKTGARAAEEGLEIARRQLAGIRAAAGDGPVERHPAVRMAAEALRQAYVTLARCEVVAPVTGLVARRAAQVGQTAAPGKPLLAIAPLDRLWVEANFKETQLPHMRIGQPVTLTADMYGSGVSFRGKVAGLSAGTGSVFSVIPPQNATGNWIKVVQRVPVRIELEPAQIKEHPLLLGLSMTVAVDTANREGRALAAVSAAARPPLETRVYQTQIEGADELAARIIAENTAPPARP